MGGRLPWRPSFQGPRRRTVATAAPASGPALRCRALRSGPDGEPYVMCNLSPLRMKTSQAVGPLPLYSCFSKWCFAVLVPSLFHINFRITLSISTEREVCRS